MSLRARLVLQAGLVVLVAVALGAMLSYAVARDEFERVVTDDAATSGSSADAWLVSSDTFVVLDASDPALRAAELRRLSDGGLELVLRETTDGRERESVLAVGPEAVTGTFLPDGGVGLRVALPGWPPAPDEVPADQMPVVPGALLGVVLATVALALSSLGLLARRLLRPLERLTDAARRLRAGDLSARTGVAGRDEIGGLGRAFDEMAETLARTESLRRDLVADVAHELRTPLTALRCQLDALRDGLRPADEAFGVLDGELQRLQRLVDDLQQLALADAGQLALHPEAVSPRAAAEAALAWLRALRGDDLPRLVLQLDTLPALRADPERLQQVLRNLLANAAAHTPRDGTITLDGEVDGEGRRVRLRVRDTGAGIPPEQLERVFERFFRGDLSRTRQDGGGSGLGLAIVRRLVEAMDGEVSARNASPGGACFEIVLPRV